MLVDCYDCIGVSGGMGEGHIPCVGLLQMIRVVKPGGYIYIHNKSILKCLRKQGGKVCIRDHEITFAIVISITLQTHQVWVKVNILKIIREMGKFACMPILVIDPHEKTKTMETNTKEK